MNYGNVPIKVAMQLSKNQEELLKKTQKQIGVYTIIYDISQS
jgi:hypothetical protein